MSHRVSSESTKFSLFFSLSVFALATACKADKGVEPFAEAGNDQVIPVGSVASLSGAGSRDVDGQITGYSWALISSPSGSMGELTGLDTEAPQLLVDEAGTFTLQLVVTDSVGNASLPDQVTVTGVDFNERPIAALSQAEGAGDDVNKGMTINLDGSESYDPEGAIISYKYDVIISPDGAYPIISWTPDASDAVWTVED